VLAVMVFMLLWMHDFPMHCYVFSHESKFMVNVFNQETVVASPLLQPFEALIHAIEPLVVAIEPLFDAIEAMIYTTKPLV
jgi:hypothetical protein